MRLLAEMLVLIAAVTGGVDLAQAQPSNPPPASTSTSEIVVQAPKPLSMESQIEAVGAPNSATDQMARWPDSVCIRSFGLAESDTRLLANEIRHTSQELHLPSPAPHCLPNVVIIVTDDPPALWKNLSTQRLWRDRYDHILATPESAGKAVTWLRSEDETPADGRAWGGSIVLNAKTTRIGLDVRTDMQALTIVLDAKQVAGLNLNAFVAYLTMVILTPVKPDLPTLSAVTSLNLFHRANVERLPSGLTTWDRAYLRGLYGGDPGATGGDQQQRIREMMTRAGLR